MLLFEYSVSSILSSTRHMPEVVINYSVVQNRHLVSHSS